MEQKKRLVRAIEIAYFEKNKTKEKKDLPKIRSLIVGVMYDRDARRKRITERLKQRLNAGMVDEVKQLIDNGIDTETLIYYGLEYKYITLFLTGKLTYDEMVRDLEIAIHQFAKRQMTWFRGMERKGVKINWLNGEMPIQEKVEAVLELLSVVSS